MAGYFIYSLDWDKFHSFVENPSAAQLERFADVVSDTLDRFDSELRKGDPVRHWPSEPGPLGELLRRRLMQPDWYVDLSDGGKTVWDWAIQGFVDEAKKKDMGFRAHGDGISFEVIDLARRHHGIGLITDSPLSHFGTRPYRYHPPGGRLPSWGDWMPYHSMHTPEEVKRLLEELKEAGPTIMAAEEEWARNDYEEELLPAVQRVARAKRLLYIGVDT
jgi:hypothetical protein